LLTGPQDHLILFGMLIDLHSHTNESDGSASPSELIDIARRGGIGILAITDHDTFAGYDCALPIARAAGIDLICGIEISAKLHGVSAHLLGYFFKPDEISSMRNWVKELQVSRRERNVRLAARLRELGVQLTLEEAESRGRAQTGRPHFAELIVQKGYAGSLQEAFDKYLDESAPGYVTRNEPEFFDAIQRIRNVGGIASLAHPVRLKCDLLSALPQLLTSGLNAIEAYHTDHTTADTSFYLSLAERHRLLRTGGSDFHGATKPGVELGKGRGGNLHIPGDLVEKLRAAAAAASV
jgi:predicted metal-dependent phosphoesterase TrpH